MIEHAPGHKIIGGMFGLELGVVASARLPSFFGEPRLLLATARSAFMLLGQLLRPRTVWLPSYLCSAVLAAFPPELTRVCFYAVDECLRPVDDEWLAKIAPGDLAVFIDYFGFTLWNAHGAEARRRGAWVVEDACQAMLNERFSEHAHYLIYSPRKFVGVPDGGILSPCAGAECPQDVPALPPAEWWLEALAASKLRAEFDRHGGERKWFELFQRTDAAAPLRATRMSELTALVLEHCVDYGQVSRRRRDNYHLLASELRHLAMFPDLPAGVVPLGFPIRLQDRDRVRNELFGSEIYPPVHWPIAGMVPARFGASHRLVGEIMTLPCDQRYGEDDMRRVLDRLRAADPVPAH